MARVQLRRETGNFIHFSHPFWWGGLLVALSLVLIYFSDLEIPIEYKILFQAGSVFSLLSGFAIWFYRFDVRFHPNTRSYEVSHGVWPLINYKEGPYDELIGVVLSKKMKRRLLYFGFRKKAVWESSFAFTSIDQPFSYFTTSDEEEARYQIERFAKHFQTKAFDRTDPINIIETNWNELGLHQDEKTETQNVPDFNFEAPPKGVVVEHGRKGFRVVLPLQGHRSRFVRTLLAGLFLTPLSLVYFSMFSQQNELLTHSLPLFLFSLTLGLLSIIAGAIGFFGQERLMCYKGKVHTDIAFLSIPMWEKSLSVEKIENIRIIDYSRKSVRLGPKKGKHKKKKENKNPKGSSPSFQLIIDADYQRIRFAEHKDHKTLNWVRLALVSTIFERDKAA